MSTASKAKKGKIAKSRDKTGRFVPGASGNPLGRPRKRPAPPWTFSSALANALVELVSVRGPDGSMQVMEARDLIVKTLVHNTVKAKPTDQTTIMQKWSSAGAFDQDLTEPEPEDMFSQAELQLLEKTYNEVFPDLCARCAGPTFPGSLI